ncbi:MAG: flagellar basal body rod protein FlgC [Proteobacteria bacterium]|nr:flagellar basal body rod protein FlgC [Pseudomonadota bacterium]RKZ79246.1 MAG: flagellar basal body rod protein FlgC [Gammaproteobacteria bacterium]
MGLFNNFNISGSAMTANTVRMNLVASNLANVNSAASSVEGTYKSRQAVFKTVMDEFSNDPSVARVGIDRIVESDEPLKAQYQPNHPNANEDGYVFMPNVNPVEAMANMIDASRSYQTNVEVLNTTKQLLMQTINMGK